MKCLIYSDVHFSQDSSIIRTIGSKYSTRLEHLIKSLNWAEKLAEKEKCKVVFNLGDMFDKPNLNAMEISALKDVEWINIPHFILVGNHDSNVGSLEYNSTEVLAKIPNFKIVSKPESFILDNTVFHLLPYIVEDNRKPLKEYIQKEKYSNVKYHIALSHNDIKGFQFGKFKSPEGFLLEEIDKECDLFLNGHLHTPSFLSKKIVNVGNLCGQNFSEDNFKTAHSAWILDTDTLQLTPYENPYSFNFYKLEIDDKHPSLSDYNLKNNAVLMIKCDRKYYDKLNEEIKNYNNTISAYRIIVYDNNIVNKSENNIKIEKVDYIKTFNDFIINNLGNSDLIIEELNNICKEG